MPAVIGMLQAMSSQPLPSAGLSTSTMQMRQLPGTDSCGCQQKYGIEDGRWRCAACITVWSVLGLAPAGR